ncbi:MAG: BMP family ABC transporter substrate-binding protein [Clostridium sp.]|nr:BMP family ABC transporter substrate-binding protein [Clostridium sp.]
MKKRILYLIASLILAGALAGCADGGGQKVSPEDTGENSNIQQTQGAAAANPMQDAEEDLYGDFREEGGEIAFVSSGGINDGSYNESIYEGIRVYAQAAGVSFSCYNVDAGDVTGRVDVIESAIFNEAKVIVCAGYDFQEAVGELQEVYPEIVFLMVDGIPVDAKGEPVEIMKNVHCISFAEEQAGYLAGYLTVLEGYRSLGFIGGKKAPAVERYGYGYLQGIDAAAAELGLENVEVNYWYAGTFQPEQKIYDKASKWYAGGTQVIFACGGALYESVLEAAEKENGLLIGVDADQSGISERFLTSAVKDVSNAVVVSLDSYYAVGHRWPDEFAGQNTSYGVKDNCVGIPVLKTRWRFKNVTMEKYYEISRQMKQDQISVSDEIEEQPHVSSITVNYG